MKNRDIIFTVLAVMLGVGLLGGTACADEMGGKLQRGALNTTSGWAELPIEVVKQTSDNPYQGLTYGFMDGLSHGLQRTLYGAWDLVTFAIPPYEKPVMNPETLFDSK